MVVVWEHVHVAVDESVGESEKIGAIKEIDGCWHFHVSECV